MNASSVASKRKEKDISKLLMSKYEVKIGNEQKMNEIYVIFFGPKDSPYEEVMIFL